MFNLGNAASGLWDKYFDRDSPNSEIREDFFVDDIDTLRSNLNKPTLNTFDEFEEYEENIVQSIFEKYYRLF